MTKQMQERMESLAERFERDVYMADPEMTDSNPAKLYSCGFTAAVEIMEERVRELEEALARCIDELVEHYNQAKCHHCGHAIDEGKKALGSKE